MLDQSLLIVASILMGGSALLIFLGFYVATRPTVASGAILEPLDLYAVPNATTVETMELQTPFRERVLRPTFQRLAGIVGSFQPENSLNNLRADLIRGGLLTAPLDFLGSKAAGALFGGCLGIVFFLLIKKTIPGILLPPACFVIGFYAPNFWLKQKIQQRAKQILRALPDALDLLTVSVEAGLAFEGALNRLCERTQGPLSDELRVALAEMRVGKTRAEALLAITERVDQEDFRNLILAIVQSEQIGAPIAKVLRIQSAQMRLRRRQRAEEAAHKAPIKMLFPMVFLIFPSIFIIILGPVIPVLLKQLHVGF